MTRFAIPIAPLAGPGTELPRRWAHDLCDDVASAVGADVRRALRESA